MKFITAPKIIRKIFKKIIWRIDTDKKNLYLTFDDCSDNELTDWVLSVLEKNNIKATFFCTAKYIKDNDILEKISKNGHYIGNHSYSHFNGLKTSNKKYLEDIEKSKTLIKSDLFRPPYGKLSLRQFNYIRNNFLIIMWDVLSYDFEKKTTKEQCFDIIKKHTKKGSIIVFHTIAKAKKNIQFCLPATIEYFTNKGYKFKNLADELL